MAEGPVELHDIPYQRLFPWLRLCRGVKVAIDARKLILAALGLAILFAGWMPLDRLFPSTPPVMPRFQDDPVPSPFDDETFGSVVREAAITVTDPFRTIIGPFITMFSVSADPSDFRGFWHALLASLWAVIVWGIFGGAIARIATVQVATGERVGIVAALRYALRKGQPLIASPLTPFLGVVFFAVLCALMGLAYRFDNSTAHAVVGALAFLPLLAGLVMAIILGALAIGWPLMHAAVAAEGEDAFDSISRIYAYVYQRPGLYLFYTVLAWFLGVIGLIVVGVFARMVVRLAVWGLSFGGPDDVVMALFYNEVAASDSLAGKLHWGWLQVVWFLAYGWVYSYFWTAASIIYLLLRHDVDGTDWSDLQSVGSPVDLVQGFQPASEPEADAAAGPSSAATESEGPP